MSKANSGNTGNCCSDIKVVWVPVHPQNYTYLSHKTNTQNGHRYTPKGNFFCDEYQGNLIQLGNLNFKLFDT